MRIATLSLLIVAAGCDTALPDDGPDAGSNGPPSAEATPVALGAAFPDGGDVEFGFWNTGTFGADGTFGAGPGYDPSLNGTWFKTFTTSLWMTGQQDGQTRFSGVSNAFGSAYTTCRPSEAGFYQDFRLASGVEYTLGDWPVDLGAPLTAAGAPQVYGDRMSWQSFCTGATGSGPAAALQDIRFNQAVFQHTRADLTGVRFFRYEITNTGDSPVTDLRAGFYSDADVGGHRYSFNLLGGTDRYATVYVSPSAPDEFRLPGAVAAIGLLETPRAAPLAARRIEYRNGGPRAGSGDPGVPLTEAGLGSGIPAIVAAMRGLDDNGDPILDPTTGLPSTFMYGGDPVAGTGWLDGTLPGGARGWDLRVLQSTAPITLAPGETVVLTAVVLATVQDDLPAGLATVDALFGSIAADPSLWRFPVASE